VAKPEQAELRDWHDWTDPDFFAEGRQSEYRFLPLFLRQILPKQVRRTKLTLTGWMLVFVAIGIGSAAYNTASNILFMTLSLLLSSLVLSGMLSLINFRKLKWELNTPTHLQAGEVGVAEINLENGKSVFPCMSICFRVGRSGSAEEAPLYLSHALPASGRATLEWTFEPQRRGPCRLCLEGLESKFPFGFLVRSVGQVQEREVLVWPARIAYSFTPKAVGRRLLSGSSRRHSGLGNDLLNIRAYVSGDAPRLIHWKATARTNKLMVRQLAQEGEGGFHLEIDPDAARWPGESFETLCSIAFSLADDLFHAGRLETVRILGFDRVIVRGLRDLYGIFDTLSTLVPMTGAVRSPEGGHLTNQITFRPLGSAGAAIYVDELQAGQTDD